MQCFARRVFRAEPDCIAIWDKRGPRDGDWEVQYFQGQLDLYEIQRIRARGR